MRELIDFFFMVKFFPSLAIGAVLLARYLPKRKYYLLRLVVMFMAMTAISVLLWSAMRSQQIYNALGGFAYILCDALFFFEIVLLLCFCFRCNFFDAMLYNVGGWSIEHIAYSLSMIFGLALGVENILIDYSVEYFVITVITFLVVYIVAAIASWALCRNGIVRLDRTKVLLPSCLIVVVTVVMNIYTPVAEVPAVALIIIKIFAVICCIISLCLVFNMFENGRYRYELDTLEQLDRKKTEQYEISRETIDIINIKCHDLKKMIGAMLGQRNIVSDKELQDISKQICIYDALVNTGNKALDLILTEKSLYCEKNNIKLSIMADGDALWFMSDGDIYAFFGNILDNAVEACMKLEPEKRVISLQIKSMGGTLAVHEDNYYSGNITYVNGVPRTSKSNTNDHGYGILSIRRIAEKYEGGVSLSAQNNVFSLDAVIPAPGRAKAV